MDLSDLKDPVEVWNAINCDQTELIDLLRSDKKLTKRTRENLALWLEGYFRKSRQRGRPKKGKGLRTRRFLMAENFYRDKVEDMKAAGVFYGNSAETLELAAYCYGIEPEKFRNYMRRPQHLRKPQRQKRRWDEFENYQEWKDDQKWRTEFDKKQEENLNSRK